MPQTHKRETKCLESHLKEDLCLLHSDFALLIVVAWAPSAGRLSLHHDIARHQGKW